MKRYALLSVYDKAGISDLTRVLVKSDYEIISTGGTYETLKKDGIKVTPIEEITGNSRDSFDGRMKTISFQIESGILFDRKNASHVEQAKELNIPQIDIVICNLYPFEQKPSIETIDVGGPTMIRAAAKNYQNVIAVVDPDDYQKVSNALENNEVSEEFKKELAAKAFYHLSFYDSQIGSFFSKEKFPQKITIPLKKVNKLRYGENPHQEGAFYIVPKTNSPLSRLKKLWGRDLSGTNVGDIYAGVETIRQFDMAAACVIKHLSPCGIALGGSVEESLDRAVKADPVSAFGGVIVINRPMDLQTARIVAAFKKESEGNIDIIAVPKISEEALELLKGIRKSMGIYTFGSPRSRLVAKQVADEAGDIPAKRSEELDLKYFAGGVLLQDFDDEVEESFKKWEVVTKNKPTEKQLELARFGFKTVKSVRSNAVIVIDKGIPMTRGIGSGQTSRVGATKIALEQAGENCKGGILVSDSFFPFDDSVKLAVKFGISVIVEQGGSVNDQASIDAANKAGIPMIFTGRRAFRH